MKPKHILILSALAIAVCLVFAVVIVLVIGRVSPASLPPVSATDTPGPTPTPSVLSFTGQGDDFIMFDNPRSGLTAFGIRHIGEHFFSVTLNDSGGRYLVLLTNEIGEYEGQSVEHLERGGYVLEIKADGPWYVVIGLPE